MSIRILNDWLSCPIVLPPIESALMLLLAYKAFDNGRAEGLSFDLMEKKTGLSHKSIQRAIKGLSEKRLLVDLTPNARTKKNFVVRVYLDSQSTYLDSQSTCGGSGTEEHLDSQSTYLDSQSTWPPVKDKTKTLIVNPLKVQKQRIEENLSSPQPEETLQALAQTSTEPPATPAPVIPTADPELTGSLFDDHPEEAPETGAQTVDRWFNDFWEHYPKTRRVGKPQAKAKFAAIVAPRGIPDLPTMKLLMQGLARWRASDQWCRDGGAYCPAPLPWLNKQAWEADPKPYIGNSYERARHDIPSFYLNEPERTEEELPF